ncbi:lysosomal proton-coupled steroid conjugate and bile acid symporter SLC46A3-like [Brevipalpus obovatus]|uniref:lysosomal proton-coupled steroid conjugate and bile acid symporter SLC46A3-like n=1 Tax=Brevipalpus obovatus TaxID=246614 RepID=UPI003D9E88A1
MRMLIEPVALFYMAAVMCEYTLIQHSISLYHCFHMFNTTSHQFCESSANITSAIKPEVTVSIRYYNGIISLLSSLSTLFIGAWSDSYGRKLPITVVILSSWTAQILCIIFWKTINSLSNGINLLFFAAMISGLSGGSSSMMANCFGYVADKTTVQNRSKAMLIMEAMVYLGESIGFLGGSFVSKMFLDHQVYGFVGLIVLHTLMLVYIIFFLEESKVNREKFTCVGLFRTRHIYSVVQTIFRKRNYRGLRKRLLIVILCIFSAQYASHSLASILYLYLRNKPLFWSTELYGYLNALSIVLNGSILLTMGPVISRFFPNFLQDDVMAILGFLSLSFGLAYLSISTTTLLVFFFPVLTLFRELIMPSMRSIVSKIVDTEERGRAFAFIAIVANFTFFIGSQSSSLIYSVTSTQFPGFVFLYLAIFAFLPASIFLFLCKRWRLMDMARSPTSLKSSNSSDLGQSHSGQISFPDEPRVS